MTEEPEQLGPVRLRILYASPFLPAIPAALAGDPGGLARAMDARRAEGHLCVLCGAPAGFALTAAPRDLSLRFCDLCGTSLHDLKAEIAAGLAGDLGGEA